MQARRAEAAAYLREIIASGVTGGMLDDATRMLDGLVPAKHPVARPPSNIRMEPTRRLSDGSVTPRLAAHSQRCMRIC